MPLNFYTLDMYNFRGSNNKPKFKLLNILRLVDEHTLGPEQSQTATALDAMGHLALLQCREEQAERL